MTPDLKNLGFTPIPCWWTAIDSIEMWVRERGVNVLWWDVKIHGMPGDFERMHQKVEAIRQQGINVWVIRQPAYLLQPDTLGLDFDQKWRSHLLAFDVDDEFEDKVGNLWTDQQPLVDYITKRKQDYNAWLPGVPLIANFNGSHVGDALKSVYDRLIGPDSAPLLDAISSDNYPWDNQQEKPDGTLAWPDYIGSAMSATLKFREWYPTRPIFTFAEICNQDEHKDGDQGWDYQNSKWVYAGSRAPRPDELLALYAAIQQVKAFPAYFPQARGGAIIDATDPLLIPVMKEFAAKVNPPKSAPAPPVVIPPTPPVVVVPPKPTPTPAKLVDLRPEIIETRTVIDYRHGRTTTTGKVTAVDGTVTTFKNP